MSDPDDEYLSMNERTVTGKKKKLLIGTFTLLLVGGIATLIGVNNNYDAASI